MLVLSINTWTAGRGNCYFTVTGQTSGTTLRSPRYTSQAKANAAARRFCEWVLGTESEAHYLAGMRKAMAAARFVVQDGIKVVGGDRSLKSHVLKRTYWVKPRTSDWVKGYRPVRTVKPAASRQS